MDGLESVQDYEQPNTLATDPIEFESVEQEPVAQTTVSSLTRKKLDPIEIDLLSQDLIKLPYEEATEKLKKTYTENDWTDKELAAQKVSEVADILNYRDEIQPEFNLDTDVDTAELTMKLLSSAFDDDTKIKFIEDWRFKLKESLYNTDNADSLMFASAKEKLIDDYAMQLRRNIKAGDTGLIMDSLARGAEAALVPLADVTDLALGTGIGTKFREYALEHQNPEKDSSISALFSSGAGSIVGFAATKLNPYTAFGYLGATLISQGKQVYDEAYKVTGSEEAAKQALANSSPGIALGVFADRLIGGTLASTLKGQKGFLGTLTGMSAGAVGMAAQSVGTGTALAAATGMEEYEPQLGQVAKEAAVGAALGGLVGGFADLTRTEVTFKSLNDQVRSVFKKNNAEGAPVKQEGERPTNADEFLQQYVVEDGAATAEEPTIAAPTDGRAIPLTPEAVIASAADPLSADILFQNITELGVPEESAIGIQTLGAELTRLSREAMGVVRPRAGEEYEKYIKGEEETITAIEAINPELAKKVKVGLDKWVQIQKEYAENPQKAAEAAAVHTRFEEMSARVKEEASRLVKTYVRRPIEETPETTGYEDWSEGYQVFDVYHGTPTAGFTAFSKERLGTNTGAPSAKMAFFGANTPEIANEYAALEEHVDLSTRKGRYRAMSNFIRTHELVQDNFYMMDMMEEIGTPSKLRKEIKILKKAEQETIKDIEASDSFLENKFKGLVADYKKKNKGESLKKLFDEEREKLKQYLSQIKDDIKKYETIWKDMQDYFDPEMIKKRGGPGVFPLKLRAKNPLIVDAPEKFVRQKGLSTYIAEAKEAGHDLVIFKNINDPVPGDVYAWFESNQVRSRWARFEKGKESSAELDADVVDINAATVSGPTVLSAARAMPISGPIPDAMKSNLQKVVPGMDYGYTPQPVTVALINRILTEITDPKNPLQIELASEGYMGPHMGFVDEKTHRLVIRREGFKDIERVRSTLAHEAGHLLDNLARTDTVKNWIQTYPASVDEPVAIKLIRLGLPLDPMFSVDVILAEARDLSSQWRPGWETAEPVPTPKPKNMTPEQERHYEYLRYRNNNNELKADVISAILNRPQFVKAGFPNIWKAFETGLKQQPILKDFWNSIQDMNVNPNKLNEFVTTERQVGRLKQAEAKAKNAAEEILAAKEEKRSLIRKLGQRLKDRLLNKRAVAREFINKITDENKKILAEELYGKTYAAAMSDNYGAKFLNEQEITVFNKVQALKNEYPEGSNPNIDFKNILRSDHVLYDTTEEMHNIESDPSSYRDAFNLVKKVVNGINPKSIVNQLDVTGLTGKALTDQIAKLHLYGDAKQRSDITNLIITDSATGKPKKALTPEELKAIEILADGAFDARRYMGTGDTDPRTAEVEMALMKQRLGDNLFKKLRALVDEHHDVVFNYMWPRIKESQIFSPKLERRIELNRRSYSTMTAIKYFEKDPHITASVRKAVGNLNKIGDEWASTIAKSAMIGSRADHQISTNAAIELARMAGETMTVVYPKVTRTVDASGKSSIYVESLYKTQKEMQQENPQNSYLIGTDKGKSILYEIENPRWGQMFESSKLEEMPVLKAGLTLLEDFNRFGIEREIKTALSFPFYLRSKWYDHAQEALVAGSWEFPGLPFHTSKTLRELRRDAAEFERKLRRNEVDPEIQGLIDNYGLPFRMTQETGGYHDPHLKAENMIYEEIGVKIPTEEELDIPIKVNRFINKQLDKIGFGRLRRAVESDEVRAKIAMYLVGKRIKGYDDATAARIARELGGTPDPFGGGTESTAINKLFLFGRAHVNGMRALATIHQDNPTSFWTQYMYRKGLPRMLMSSAIITPLIGALFGEEEERLYKKFLDKVPSFDKISKLCMPLGFVDPKGFFRGFNVNANEVNHDWKSAYLALPLSRELVTTDTLMSPFFKNIEDYIETGAFSAKRIAKSAVEAFQSAFTGQLAPGIMSATRMAQFAGGGNPYDYYRNRGIFPKDIEEAGNFVDKSYRYFLWSLNQTAPGVFSFNRDRQTSTEPTTAWDAFANVPIAGATLRSFVRNSSYGDLEKYQELQQLKIERDADIRLKMKDETRKIYNSYRKGQAYVTRMGKDWYKFSDPEQIRRIHMLNNWHSRVYRHGFNGMRAAFENDDADALEREAQKLETASRYAAELLK